MRRRPGLGALLAVPVALLAVAVFARPAAADDLFVEANRDYAAQHYEVAIAKYEQLVKGGLRHEDLYYNLGNSYYRAAQAGQAGRVGRAILAWERALRLAPGLDDARYNLEVAREAVALRLGKDTIVGVGEQPLWIRVVTWAPMRTLTWTFLALDVIFFGVLIALRFLPTGFLRTGLVAGNVFCGLAGLLVGLALAGQLYFLSAVRMSVVVADEVVMREGPDPSRRELPKLHAGHSCIVLRDEHGWRRIRLANGMEGWVPGETVEEI